MIDSIQELQPVQGINVTKTTATAPWPMSKRVMFAVRYPCIDYEQSHHILLVSEKGAESRNNYTEQDAAEFALARCHVAGWSFQLVYEAQNLVDTRIFHVSSADAGGKVQTSI